MSSVDNRVVRMTFDNSKFKQAAAETKTSLDSVTQSVVNAGKSKGLLNLQKDMQQVSLHASKMQVAVVTAIGTITAKAVNAGLQLGKSLLVDPLKQGFQEYESLLTKQNVIMNATHKSANQVKKYLDELNTYSDKTIYSFANMTDSVMKFVNAGVPLPKAVRSIEGISNAAALAGATVEESGRAMYNFAQALSTGSVKLIDWKSIELANMGTVDFKQRIIDTAVSLGTLIKTNKGYVTSTGKMAVSTTNFTSGLSKGWFTAKVLTSTLDKYSDTSTKFGRKAFLEATKVRTFTAFLSTLKESLGSGWGQVFTALLGGLKDSTNMWTNLSLAVGGVVGSFFKFVSTSLQVWRTLGGASKVAQGFKNILAPIGALFKAIGDAWHAAFPKSASGSGSALYGLSVAFEALTRPLAWLAKLIAFLVHPLTVFFAIIRLGGLIIGRVISDVVKFVKSFTHLANFKVSKGGGLLGYIKDIYKAIADTIGQISDLISKGESIGSAFKKATFHMPKLPDLGGFKLPKIGSFNLGNLFGGGGGDSSSKSLDKTSNSALQMVASVTGLNGVVSGAVTNIKQLTGNMDGANDSFSTGVTNIKQLGDDMDGNFTPSIKNASDKGKSLWDVFTKIGSVIAKFFGKIKGEDLMASLNLAVLATMGITLSQLMNSFAGMGKAATGVLKSVSGALGSLQTTARAELIKSIAIAIGILAVSLWILSRIPQDKMTVALEGLGGAVVAMGTLMLIFSKTIDKMDGKKVTFKLYALGFAIVALGAGILLLAIAMRIMNKVDVGSFVKTIALIYILFKGLEKIGNLGEKSGRKLLAAATSIAIIGAALLILATAMLLFKLVDYKSMTKAGLVLAALTVSLLLLARVPAKTLSKSGTAMLAIANAMLILAGALIIFARVDWQSIVKAGVVLLMLTLALIAMDGVGLTGAAVIVAVGLALLAIATACLMLNKVNWESIAMAGVILLGLIVAFGALLVLVTIFAPAVAVLSGLALSLALLAGAAALFALAFAVIVPLLGVASVAIVAFAIAMAVAIAAFLQTLALEGPSMSKSLLRLLQTLADTIVAAVPILIDAIDRILDAITAKVPDFAKAAAKLIAAVVKGIGDNLDSIVTAGVDLVISFLLGVADNVNKLVDAGVDLVVKLIEGIGNSALHILQAGVTLIADFLHGLATIIRNGSDEIGSGISDVVGAMEDVGKKMAEGLAKGLGKAAFLPIKIAGDLVKSAAQKAKDVSEQKSPSKVFMRIGQFLVDGLTLGIQNHAASAITAVASVVQGQIATASSYISAFVQKLDQQAIAAQAKAEGLAAAADKASAAADKTKSKKDDVSAQALKDSADKASAAATVAQTKADKAKEAADRKDEFKKADTLEKAKMRSEDAARQLDEAKVAEGLAAKDLSEAKALEAQAKSGKYSKAEADKMKKEAASLRVDAAKQAKIANALVQDAKASTASALALQKKAGAEAAAAFQKEFDAEAKAATDQKAFDALSDTDKAIKLRADAAKLQTQANTDLVAAKKLAYTDLEAANELAQKANDEADQARQYMDDATGYEDAVKQAADQAAKDAADAAATGTDTTGTATTPGNIPITGTTAVDLTASDAAAIAFQNYADTYSAATAAAAETKVLEFNQYVTSPEALTPTEIYRQTNNLLTHASNQLASAA